MYKISVPVILNDRFDRVGTLSELRRAGATRVFLALGAPSMSKANRQKDLELLRENIPFFKAAGLEVGIWFWTFWRIDVPEELGVLMKNRSGKQRKSDKIIGSEKSSGVCGFCCPESIPFIENSMEIIREYAECDPDILMFDDDFRYGFLDKNIGCYCEAHMQKFSERLGREISRDELHEKIFADKPNEERRVFLECIGESLENFAKKCRETVDKVDPKIRFAACSVMSLWDIDGTDSIKIAKLLAGNTRPLLRQIGAPYWAEGRSWNNRLQNVIELERMEYSWSVGEDIEIMTEGDVYPRPRHRVPSAFLEGFDTALRAAGVGEGIHKYMIDYTSSPTYEKGYINAHLKNADAYGNIERIFGNKKACGIGVYEKMNKFADADLSGIDEREEYVQYTFFSNGAKMLADCSIPIVYGEDCEAYVVFGENAREIPESIAKKPMILDIRAAKILKEQGIDVGLESIGEKIGPDLIYYLGENEYVSSGYNANSAFDISVKTDAEVSAYSVQGDKKYIDAYTYTNTDGNKFLVFAFDSAFSGKHRFRSYAMQRLLYAKLEWMTGEPLPAKCAGNPDLYMLCKRGEDGSLAVGLWNFFADEIYEPVVELDREYENIEYLGCTGRKEGNKLFLSPIKPFGFVFINAK